ncbi:MAG: hypothetical protein ACRC45_02820 [Cetobacterium sp.]
MYLADFTKYLRSSEDRRDKCVFKAMSLIMMYHNKHKSKVSSSESKDLLMDLICQAYSAYEVWRGDTYAEFCTFLYFNLMDWEKTILTKYTGIKVSRSDLRKAKQTGIPIKLKKVNYEIL